MKEEVERANLGDTFFFYAVYVDSATKNAWYTITRQIQLPGDRAIIGKP